jgi:hypothetical protein
MTGSEPKPDGDWRDRVRLLPFAALPVPPFHGEVPMPSYVITAHGNLHDERKFIVPAGVRVYFFGTEGSKLHDPYSVIIMKMLCCEAYHGKLKDVHQLAVDVFQPLELCPDYTFSEDSIDAGLPGGFILRSGLYRVGKPFAQGPEVVLERGKPRRLSEWVRGSGANGPQSAFGDNFYVATCREHDASLPKIPSPPTHLFPEQSEPVKVVSPSSEFRGTYGGGIAEGWKSRNGTLLTNRKLAALKRRLRQGEPLIPQRTT